MSVRPEILFTELNAGSNLKKVNAHNVGGRNGIGIKHALENRIIGTKSRGVYEAPGMEVLGEGVRYVYQSVLDRRATSLFEHLSKLAAGAAIELQRDEAIRKNESLMRLDAQAEGILASEKKTDMYSYACVLTCMAKGTERPYDIHAIVETTIIAFLSLFGGSFHSSI